MRNKFLFFFPANQGVISFGSANAKNATSMFSSIWESLVALLNTYLCCLIDLWELGS